MIFEQKVKDKIETSVSEKVEEKKPEIKKKLIGIGLIGLGLYLAYRHGWHEGFRDGVLISK